MQIIEQRQYARGRLFRAWTYWRRHLRDRHHRIRAGDGERRVVSSPGRAKYAIIAQQNATYAEQAGQVQAAATSL